MQNSPAIAGRMPSTRNAVTNGSRLHTRGIDGRTRAARRFRDILESLTADIGGALTEADKALVRTAAQLVQKSEAMQADAASGKPVDAEQLVRLSNVLSRVLSQLNKRAKPKPKTLAEHLAGRGAE